MHLQTQQMADAMRKNTPVTPTSNAACPGSFGQSHRVHDVTQDAMGGQVHVAIIAAARRSRREAVAALVQCLHQIGEAASGIRSKSADIRSVTAILAPRVDQKERQSGRCQRAPGAGNAALPS